VAMTMRLMDEFGVTPEVIRDPDTRAPRQIIMPQDVYRPTRYAIEPDASNASYFLAAAAVHPGATVTIEGLGSASIQGDIGFASLLRRMGALVEMRANSISVTGPEKLVGIEADFSTIPDTAQTLGVVALFAEGETTLRGLHTLRVKETDRVAALATELVKLGGQVRMDGDDLTIEPPTAVRAAEIETYDDHRMAMSFAIAGTAVAGITILNAECVNKTYPGFFQDLPKLTKTP